MRKKAFPAAYSRLLQAACLSLIFGLAWSLPAQAHTTGRAFVAFVNAPALGAGPLYLADTGELSPAGGWVGAEFLSAEVAGVLSANVLNAATMGTRDDVTGQANSSSSLADVVVLPGHAAQLTASFVRAQAGATDFGSQGSAEIQNLTFGGISVAVTGLPNQRVEIPGTPSLFELAPTAPLATLVLNEQTVTSDATSQAITVNALHLILATGEEVILASAKSFVKLATGMTLARAASNDSCASTITHVTKANWLGGSTPRPPIILASVPGPTDCVDFVTGGGHFEPPNSEPPSRVNFGFNAGPRSVQNPDPKGHLNFIDHTNGTHVSGTSVTAYGEAFGDSLCRFFEGSAKVNGDTGHNYRAEVCDYGEPGRDDRFRLFVDGALVADNVDSSKAPNRGELDGGNIQLHKPKCPKPAAFEEGREKPLKEI